MTEMMNETMTEVIEEPIIKEILMVDLETEETEIEVDGVVYIEKTTYRVYSDGSKVKACSARYPKPSDEPVTPEPTQLDRIEAAVNNIVENGTNSGSSYNEMAEAIAEGVNDV